MLVKQNLLLNGGKLQSPVYMYARSNEDIFIKDNKVYIKNLKTSAAGFTSIGMYEKNMSLDTNKTYYPGFFGSIDGDVDIYKGTYKPYKSKGNFNYIELKGGEVKGPLHIRSYHGANVILERLCLFEGEIGDIFIPCIEDLPTDKQPLLPPEGNYKEIQPR